MSNTNAKNLTVKESAGERRKDEEDHTTRKTVILTEIIAPYRIPVFNTLTRYAELDLHTIFLAETDNALRQWRVYTEEIRFSYEVLPSFRCRLGRKTILINRGVWSALNRVNPHVIICGGYNYPASWEALMWARRHRAEFVLWSESNSQDARGGHPLMESLKAYFLGHCDGFVVPGKAAFAYLRSLGLPEAKIVTAPNAVDNCLFAAGAEKARERAAELRAKLKLPARFILFVGRLVPEKGVFDLLEAYAKLENTIRNDIGLVFVGEGVSREELMRRAQHISPGMICLPGFSQREDLAGLYGLAEVLVLPTHSDTWGLVVNEAMACGLPIIVSSVAGCSTDLVEDGSNGYVVPPRDPEKLSASIASTLQPELQKEMSVRSLERIRNYSPDACAHGLATAAISVGTGAR